MPTNLGSIATKGVAWVSTSTVVIKVIGIVYIILVLGHLSVYEYGVVELLISIPPLMGILNLPGLEQVLVADIGRERARGDRKLMQYLVESYLALRLPLAFLAWALLFFSAPYIEQFYNQAIGDMVRILSFSFLFSPLRSLYLLTFSVSLSYQYASLFRVCEEVGKLAVVAFCLLALDMSATAVIWGYVSADVVALICLSGLFLKMRREVFGPLAMSGGWKDPLFVIKHHGKWSIFGSYLHTFGQNIRPWIIKFFLGTHAVGLFAVAYGMFQNTMSLIPIGQVVAPLIPQYLDKKRQLYELLNSSVKYHLLASIAASISMIVFMPVLIYFFFPQYADSYLLFVGLLATAIPVSLTSIYNSVFVALKAQRDLFVANVLLLASIVCILPIAVLLFGLYGIAVELFVSATIFSLNRYWKLHQLLPGYQFKFEELVSVTAADRLLFKMFSTRFRRTLQYFFKAP